METKTYPSASLAWLNIARIRGHEHPTLMLFVFVETAEERLRVLGTFFRGCQVHLSPLLGHHDAEANQHLHHDLDGDHGHHRVDGHGVDLRHEDVCGRQNLLCVHRGHGAFHAYRLGGTGLGLYPGLCGHPYPYPCNRGLCGVHRYASDVRGRRGLNKKKKSSLRE